MKDFTLIGVDGGASKVAGFIIEVKQKDNSFSLSDIKAEIQYSGMKNFSPKFKPIGLQSQLKDIEENSFNITELELKQSFCLVEACRQVIVSLFAKADRRPVLIGIGMPGLKTEDKRGIAAFANGPRILDYAAILENEINKSDIGLIAPIACLGSDADYCGIGEEYANQGSFKNFSNAYYLGGGTGTADALKLEDKLIPLDQTKTWLAKTWEMKNEQGISLEKYTSFSGIQSIYADKAKIDVQKLIKDNIYVPQIAIRALEGDEAAIDTFRNCSINLSTLLYERITTLYCGWQGLFSFLNKNRQKMKMEHQYIKSLFDRLVIGQRLGDFLYTRSGFTVLAKPLYERLSKLIHESSCLSEEAKEHYLHGSDLKRERLVLSKLREAPALGAGIDAYLKFTKKDM